MFVFEITKDGRDSRRIVRHIGFNFKRERLEELLIIAIHLRAIYTMKELSKVLVKTYYDCLNRVVWYKTNHLEHTRGHRYWNEKLVKDHTWIIRDVLICVSVSGGHSRNNLIMDYWYSSDCNLRMMIRKKSLERWRTFEFFIVFPGDVYSISIVHFRSSNHQFQTFQL